MIFDFQVLNQTAIGDRHILKQYRFGFGFGKGTSFDAVTVISQRKDKLIMDIRVKLYKTL